MHLFSGFSPSRAGSLLAGLCAVGSLVLGGCTPDEMNQPSVPISQAVAPTGGLIGEWKLDEMGGTIAADTKSGYDATVQGGAAFVGQAKLGRALNVDNGPLGTGGKYAEMPSNPVLDTVQRGNYTISAWFWSYSIPPGGTSNPHWAVVVKAGFNMGLVYEPDRKFTMRHYLTGDTLAAATSAGTYGLNAWHHLAGVVNRTAGTVTLYVDGDVAGTKTFTANRGPRNYGTTRFRIGKGSSTWAADGKVDQVRIYNRALLATEITNLYTETIGTTGLSNCIGADSSGDRTTYSDRRVFLESQGWWGQNTNGNVPAYGNAEHIHVGMCFPLRDTVSGTTTFTVRIMGHNLPVGSIIQSTSLHDPDQGTHITLASIPWNDTITQAEHDVGVMRWATVQVNTLSPRIPNGLRELRNLTIVERPNDTHLEASSGWCWTIKNDTTPPVASGTCATSPTFTMARGWYDCFEYKIAEVRNWDPYANIPHGADYQLTIGGRDGAGDNNNTLITGWEVRLDPNFHAVPQVLGTAIDSGATPANGKVVTIRAANMTTGMHKLVVISHAKGNNCTEPGKPSQSGEVSAVLAIPIKVN
jgi:hypothetical protein